MSKIHDWGKSPNPGSPKAVEQGCICAVLDNLHGKGLEGGFYITVGCKLHDPIEGKG